MPGTDHQQSACSAICSQKLGRYAKRWSAAVIRAVAAVWSRARQLQPGVVRQAENWYVLPIIPHTGCDIAMSEV